MNRQLNQKDSSESLELMLDVLSNVFGGVILICCLLAILPRHSNPPPLSPVESARSQMLERRIDSAQSQLEDMRQKVADLTDATDSDLVKVLNERAELEVMLQALQKEIGKLDGDKDFSAEIMAVIELGESKALADKLSEITRKIISQENITNVMRDKISAMEKRREALNEQKEAISTGRNYSIRFPKEKADEGNPFPVIIRYGRIYPLSVGKNFEANPAIRKIQINDDATSMKPIPGKGWLLPRDLMKLEETLKSAKKEGLYVSVYLYPDSHTTFNAVKPNFFRVKIDYGMEFIPAKQNLSFGIGGAKPPKL